MYRIIDWVRNDRDGQPAAVTHIEYDPNRSARIALVQYEDGEKRYILAPEGLKAGMTVVSGPDAEPKLGNCLPLAKIPTGLDDPQYRDAARGRRQAVPLGGRGSDLDGPRGKLGPDHPALGGSAADAGRLPGDDRHGG